MASCTSVNIIQGPQGQAGAVGTNGTNGLNAFTNLTASFTVPAEGANATATVSNTAAFASGETVWLQGAGFFQVNSITNATQMVLQNLKNSTSLSYLSNVPPGTIIASTSLVIPSGIQGPGASQYYGLWQQQQNTGVDAGDFTSGDWRTVPINVAVADTGSVGTIVGNQITLISGTYRSKWRVCGYQVNKFQSRLFNNTDASVIAYGSNSSSDSAGADMSESLGEMRFTISASKVIILQARCQTTKLGNGFGINNGFGGTEVYSSLEMNKEI